MVSKPLEIANDRIVIWTILMKLDLKRIFCRITMMKKKMKALPQSVAQLEAKLLHQPARSKLVACQSTSKNAFGVFFTRRMKIHIFCILFVFFLFFLFTFCNLVKKLYFV